MPKVVQSAAYVGILESPATVGAELVQMAETFNTLSLTTVELTVEAVTHSGFNRTEGTCWNDAIVAPESVVEEFTRPDGGLTCARK